jgi:ketosteroid isomerase-like protein
LLTPFEASTAEPEEILEHGDQVVAVVKGRVRIRDTSDEIENRTAHLWTFRGATVVSMRIFPQPEKALEAAGLPG